MQIRKALVAILGITLLILGLILLLYSYYTLNRSNRNTGLTPAQVQQVKNIIKTETASSSAAPVPSVTVTPAPTKRPVPVNQTFQVSPSPAASIAK